MALSTNASALVDFLIQIADAGHPVLHTLAHNKARDFLRSRPDTANVSDADVTSAFQEVCVQLRKIQS